MNTRKEPTFTVSPDCVNRVHAILNDEDAPLTYWGIYNRQRHYGSVVYTYTAIRMAVGELKRAGKVEQTNSGRMNDLRFQVVAVAAPAPVILPEPETTISIVTSSLGGMTNGETRKVWNVNRQQFLVRKERPNLYRVAEGTGAQDWLMSGTLAEVVARVFRATPLAEAEPHDLTRHGGLPLSPDATRALVGFMSAAMQQEPDTALLDAAHRFACARNGSAITSADLDDAYDVLYGNNEGGLTLPERRKPEQAPARDAITSAIETFALTPDEVAAVVCRAKGIAAKNGLAHVNHNCIQVALGYVLDERPEGWGTALVTAPAREPVFTANAASRLLTEAATMSHTAQAVMLAEATAQAEHNSGVATEQIVSRAAMFARASCPKEIAR